MQPSLALYRRYRPETFAEVIGQDHVTEPLRAALANNRVHHAYLFSGPRGCGKTTSARILARALNCEAAPVADPCGECQSCRDLARGGAGSVDVIGHELAHGFTQFTAALVYVGQSGALNESVSDCFGAMVKQRALGQTADAADWLIGQGLFTSRVNGVALRSMLHPGTAYDDPKLGKDPQPDAMSGYVDEPHDDAHDNGGVHTNSGIPNRAFALAAVACGGHSWQSVGPVWYEALTRGGLPKDADFATFARATVEAATRLDAGSGPAPTGGAAMTEAPARAEAVQAAWRQVGVLGG